MVSFPNCKINLGLNILQKRVDGYHDIETVFFPIPIYDVLEIITSDEDKTEVNNTGIIIDSPGSNLCVKAYHLIQKDFPQLPSIKMHLHKVIPAGAGLGGGSADAAFTLVLLDKKYKLNIPSRQLFEYALQLGSDCPFFLLNKPCIASRRGEQLEPVTLSLAAYKMLIVNPGIHINTKNIFEKTVPFVPGKRIKEIIHQPVASWKDELVNDFEKIIEPMYPVIKELKEDMYRHGAVYAAMTGTGSTVYGIFDAGEEIDFVPGKHYFHQWIQLV